MVQEATAEKVDLAKRYELFAKAEAWLINEGVVIPFRVFSNGYVASKLTVFDGEYSSFGVSIWRYKGKHVLKEAMSLTDYQEQFAQWKLDREAALAARPGHRQGEQSSFENSRLNAGNGLQMIGRPGQAEGLRKIGLAELPEIPSAGRFD